MSVESRFAHDVADQQIQMFAMFVGTGLAITSRAALSRASGIPESTLKAWATGAAIPFHGVLTLAKFLPAEAINMLCEPAGLRFASIASTDSDWDEVANGAACLTFEILEAKKDGICHRDKARLKGKARALGAALADVIED